MSKIFPEVKGQTIEDWLKSLPRGSVIHVHDSRDGNVVVRGLHCVTTNEIYIFESQIEGRG